MPKHHQISIIIPDWLYKPFANLQYFFRKWTYWAFPDHCECCGARMYVRSYEIEHVFANGRRLLVGNHAVIKEGDKYKHLVVCRDCLAHKLENGSWKPRFTHLYGETKDRFWSAKKCDVTGENVRSFKDVEIYPYVNMTFCTIAWNHGYVSKQAVIDCVKYGKIKTSMWGVYKKKMHPMNHKRLYVNEEGELL